MNPRRVTAKFRLTKLTLVCFVAVCAFRSAFLLTQQVLAAEARPTTTPTSSQSLPKEPSKPAVKSSTSGSKGKKGKKVASKKGRRKVVQGQRTIESARVLEIQNALAAAGYYKDQPSGEWDESTTKAMSTYQQDNGFRTTGKPDALSLKKLGL